MHTPRGPHVGSSGEHDVSLAMLTHTLDRIQDQVKFADAKGGFLTTLSILLVGFIIQQSARLRNLPDHGRGVTFWIAAIVFGLYMIATFLSVAYVLLAVTPRLVDSGTHTMTFFSHIRKRYKADHLSYYRDASNMTSAQWMEELSSQIVPLSNIADRKHRLIHRAALWMIASLGLWLAVLAAMQFIQ